MLVAARVSDKALWLVVCLQEEAYYFTDKFVRPGRQSQRSLLPVLLGNVGPPDGLEPKTLVAQRIDDAFDLAQGHAVDGLAVRAGRHRTLVGVQTPVGEQIQLRVEQLPIQSFQRQAVDRHRW